MLSYIKLDWFLMLYEKHPDMRKCVQALNAMYRDNPPLWQQDDSWSGFSWLNADDKDRSITSFIRWDKKGNGIICVTNFTPEYYEDYIICHLALV